MAIGGFDLFSRIVKLIVIFYFGLYFKHSVFAQENSLCVKAPNTALLLTPSKLGREKMKIRVLIAAEKSLRASRILLRGPEGEKSLRIKRRGGPPYFWYAKGKRAAPGDYEIRLLDRKKNTLSCFKRTIKKAEELSEDEDIWPIQSGWNRNYENLYSAWIELLFDAEIKERLTFTPLHKVFYDKKRNWLYNHLGYQEDGPKERYSVKVKPDCADLPYFLRAYFAWKMRLPMGYRHCDRGSSKRAARCKSLITNEDKLKRLKKKRPADIFSTFLRRKVSYVHSGSARTGADDNESDLYPLRLSRKTLRPGSVYVDPYGHLLVISKWFRQNSKRGGMLFAVDGHPDLSVGRKRFWKGAFLFTTKIPGGGFKAFRPLEYQNERVRALKNEELNQLSGYKGFYSDKQYTMTPDQFYFRMDKVLNPRPQVAQIAYKARLEALYELILERVDSVAAGEKYMKSTQYHVIDMPDGPKIFETRGAWENFSTPARDMRLLIAIEDVRRFPDHVLSHPKRYRFSGKSKDELRSELKTIFDSFTSEKTMAYIKSDGSSQRVTMGEVLKRTKGLEVAYNPNDCVELRWGASGDELKTCKRRAPEDQQDKMKKYRAWFETRDRPPLR